MRTSHSFYDRFFFQMISYGMKVTIGYSAHLYDFGVKYQGHIW